MLEEEGFKIRESFAAVWKTLGSEFRESVYQNALAVELEKQGFKIEKDKKIPIYYSEKEVGDYVPSFIVNGKIVVEIKAVSFLAEHHRNQFFKYFKGSKMPLGFLVNFGGKELEVLREISNTN